MTTISSSRAFYLVNRFYTHLHLVPVPNPKNHGFFSTVLPFLDISPNWNQTVYGLACMASFISPNVFKLPQCCSYCQYFIPFYW